MVTQKYVKTEAGIMPEDWEICQLGKAFSKIEAGVSVNSDMRSEADFYVLKTSAVHDGIVDANESKAVIPSDYNRLRCPLKTGSIVISRMNTPMLVGEVGYTVTGYKNIYLPDRLWQIEEESGSEYDFRWLNYLLNLPRFRDAIRATATGTSDSMKNISKDRLREIAIPKPDLQEQKAIASMIADMDALIESLGELIHKKQMIRDGVVHKLMSEASALHGFGLSKVKYRIGEMGDFVGGLTGKSKHDFGHGTSEYITFLNVLTNTVVDTSVLEDVDVREGEKQNEIQYGDLLFNTSSETPEEVGMCAVFLDKEKRPYLNSFCFCFRMKDMTKIDPLFVAYYFNSHEGRKIMKVLAQGATRYNLSKSNFEDTNVIFPEYREQVEIAGILSDMDHEISQLYQKLNKYKSMKTGMMNELLTGKIRLV